MAKLSGYDGIVCFAGEDWWYHNKGHFDMKVMEEFSKNQKVIFINSVGMRVPKPGKTTNIVQKIKRKLASISKGMVQVEENFYVYSPFYIPGKTFSAISNLLLKLQVKALTKKLGMNQPLTWVVTPTVSKAINLRKFDVIYQRTDKNEMLSDGDSEFIEQSVEALKRDAKLVIYSSKALQNKESNAVKDSLHVSHGVADVFFNKSLIEQPTEMKASDRAKVVFVGAIDSHTFDLSLLLYSAKALANTDFYLIGEVSMGEKLQREDVPNNVHFLGKKAQNEVPSYLHNADVLAMFWQGNEWIEYCSPVKFKEYLTAGKPIVSTFFNGWNEFGTSNINVSNDYDEFVDNLRCAIQNGERQRLDMDSERWSHKARLIAEKLNEA